MPSKKKKGAGNGLEYELSTDPTKNPMGDMVSAMPWIFIVHPNKCYSTKKLDLKKICSPHGKVVDIVIKSDFGLATVQMDRRVNTVHGVKQVAGIQLATKKVIVKFETEGKLIEGQIVSNTSDPDPAVSQTSGHRKEIKVENLSPMVSSFMLMKAFLTFGKIHRATVIVDEKGNSTTRGKVVFQHKVSAEAAVSQIRLKPFLIGRSLKPVTVSFIEEEDPKYESLVQEIAKTFNPNIEARFPEKESFELKMALDWNKRFEQERLQREQLEKSIGKSREKFEVEMEKRLEKIKLTSCGFCKKDNFGSTELLQRHVATCKAKPRATTSTTSAATAASRAVLASKAAAASRLTAAASIAAANMIAPRQKPSTSSTTTPRRSSPRKATTSAVSLPRLATTGRATRKEATQKRLSMQNSKRQILERSVTKPRGANVVVKVERTEESEASYVPDQPMDGEEDNSSRRKSMRKRKVARYSDYCTGDFNEDDKKEDEVEKSSNERKKNEEENKNEPNKKKTAPRKFALVRQTRETRRTPVKVGDPASILERKLDEMKNEVLSEEESGGPSTSRTTKGMLSPRKSARKRKAPKMPGDDVEDSSKATNEDGDEEMETAVSDEVTILSVISRPVSKPPVGDVVVIDNAAAADVVAVKEERTENEVDELADIAILAINGVATTNGAQTPVRSGTAAAAYPATPVTNGVPVEETSSRRKSTRKRKPRKLVDANENDNEEEVAEEEVVVVKEEVVVEEEEEEATNNEVAIKIEPGTEDMDIEEINCFHCTTQCEGGLEIMKSNFTGVDGEEKARTLLQDHDVLPKGVQCPLCDVDCEYAPDSQEFVCIRLEGDKKVMCGYSVAERKDTICQESSQAKQDDRISHSQFVQFACYYATTELTFSEVAINLNISNQKVIEWRRRFGEVCVNFANNQSPIGGKGIDVSIDETAITESTQNYWIFGGMEKVSKRKFLIYIKGGRPRAERLSDVIKKYIRPGSYVTCEESNGIQFKLSRLGYKLECFKTHHLPFVREIPLARTFLRYKLAHHIFTISFDDGAARFHHFLAEIARKYPLQTAAAVAASSSAQ